MRVAEKETKYSLEEMAIKIKNTMAKKKTKPEPTMGATTSIVLNVPNPLYYEISDEVTVEKRAGKKSTIHDNMVERLLSTQLKRR